MVTEDIENITLNTGRGPLTATIRNARAHGENKTLKVNGSQLYPNQMTTLSREDFCNNEAKITGTHYKELETAICQLTGAKMAKCFVHRIRNSELQQDHLENGKMKKNNDDDGRPPVLNYVHKIHTDYSVRQGQELVEQVLREKDDAPTTPSSTKRRYQILNIWRNISDKDVVLQNPLAVMDNQELKLRNLHTSHLMVKTDCDALWYYFPKMHKEEILTFVQYDSTRDLTGLCFHTSFEIPSVGDVPTRESIETRMVVVYDDDGDE